MKTIGNIIHQNNFPLKIYDSKEYIIYWENLEGFWIKEKFDSKGNEIYYENSDGDVEDSR